MGGGKSPSQQDSKTTTTTDWPDYMKPYYSQALGDWQSSYNNATNDPFTGSLFAGKGADTEKGLSWQRNLGNKLNATGYGNDVVEMGTRTLAGDYLNPETNPFLGPTVEAATGDIERRYMRDYFPQLNSAAVAQGAYGGSATNSLTGIGIGEMSREVADARNDLYMRNYEQERQNQLAAPSMISQGVAMQATPSAMLQGVGQTEEAYKQGQLNEDFRQWMEQEFTGPTRKFNQYIPALSALTPGTSTTQTYSGSATSESPSALMGMLQGGMGGASMGSGIASLMPAGASMPWLWPLMLGAGGAAAGGLGR